MYPIGCWIVTLAALLLSTTTAFTSPASRRSTLAVLYSSSNVQEPSISPQRRRDLLTRTSPFFSLDRNNGSIEFGATARLATDLLEDEIAISDNSNDIEQQVKEWLGNPRQLALSFWDPVVDRGNNIYRLQIMTLSFAGIQLAPWVDVKMMTRRQRQTNEPVFVMESVDYDANINTSNTNNAINASINKQALNIKIEVVGELRSTGDSIVKGAVAFTTRGKLPTPLMLLPDGILSAASNTINDTIVQYAVQSFQKGAKEQFRQFRNKQ